MRLGVISTPGVAYLTKALGAQAGVMISASHNPVEDNGIKFFGSDGFKLTDEQEEEIEALLDGEDDELPRPTGADLGSVNDYFEGGQKYFQYLKQTVDEDFSGITCCFRLCTWCNIFFSNTFICRFRGRYFYNGCFSKWIKY